MAKILMRLITAIASALLVVAIPILLVTTNVRWMFFDLALYERGFARYSISAVTGLSNDQLRQVALEYMSFLRGEGPLEVSITKPDGTPLFNQRERLHLEDVRSLIRLAGRAQILSLAWIIAFLLWCALSRRWQILSTSVALGSGLTLALFLILGAAMLLFFDQIFLEFHLLSFSNELWMLDPRTDYLIRMFPSDFQQDWATQFAIMTIGEAALLVILAGGTWLVTQRRQA
ncbi:MAG: TIGR01906 family membrane protein [Chloroflexi bacterium]|nr:TIGR01906 family membrane protein [Chloroflexota bacterium]